MHRTMLQPNIVNYRGTRLRRWCNHGGPHVRITFNCSAKQLGELHCAAGLHSGTQLRCIVQWHFALCNRTVYCDYSA